MTSRELPQVDSSSNGTDSKWTNEMKKSGMTTGEINKRIIQHAYSKKLCAKCVPSCSGRQFDSRVACVNRQLKCFILGSYEYSPITRMFSAKWKESLWFFGSVEVHREHLILMDRIVGSGWNISCKYYITCMYEGPRRRHTLLKQWFFYTSTNLITVITEDIIIKLHM